MPFNGVKSLAQIEKDGDSWQIFFLGVREVVITSVLDEDPPYVGVGGLCKIPPV